MHIVLAADAQYVVPLAVSLQTIACHLPPATTHPHQITVIEAPALPHSDKRRLEHIVPSSAATLEWVTLHPSQLEDLLPEMPQTTTSEGCVQYITAATWAKVRCLPDILSFHCIFSLMSMLEAAAGARNSPQVLKRSGIT